MWHLVGYNTYIKIIKSHFCLDNWKFHATIKEIKTEHLGCSCEVQAVSSLIQQTLPYIHRWSYNPWACLHLLMLNIPIISTRCADIKLHVRKILLIFQLMLAKVWINIKGRVKAHLLAELSQITPDIYLPLLRCPNRVNRDDESQVICRT